MKICVIGCGNHSAMVHGPSYVKYAAEHPDTVLAGCCDLNEDRAQAYRDQFGFQRAYTDMEQMLTAEKPDAVCVIVPEWLVCDTSIAVIERGYHVLLEKPPGLCLADTQRMAAVAEKAGVINQVAFNRRFMPLIQEFRRLICAEGKDSMQSMIYEFYRFRRTETSFETIAIHGIDAARYIMGCDCRQVHFTYQELPQMGPGVINIRMDCEFENGVLAQLHFNSCTGLVTERFCVNALDQSFFLRSPIWDGFDAPGELLHVKEGKTVLRLSGTDVCESQQMYLTNGFYEENRTFFDCVRNGVRSNHDIRSTLQSVELAEAIRDRRGCWVKGERNPGGR